MDFAQFLMKYINSFVVRVNKVYLGDTAVLWHRAEVCDGFDDVPAGDGEREAIHP